MPVEKVRAPVVLVVDDEPLIRWSLAEGLAEAGYVVRLAATGADARAVLASIHEPLVVLLDLRLPDVNDLSLLRYIRASCPEATVIVMTAHGSPEDARVARELGVFRFISKPFDVTEITGIVGGAARSST